MNENIKQIILIRKDLKMRRGKEMSQACHASMKVIFDMMGTYDPEDRLFRSFNLGLPYGWVEKRLRLYKDSPLEQWVNGLFTKVVVSVDSEEELLKLHQDALNKNLPCSLIKDAGHTEFKEPTYTAVAIGPAESEEIDKLTGHLKLL